MTTNHANLKVLDHPLIQEKLAQMRCKETPKPLFRQLLKEIALLIGYEVTRALPTYHATIETPLAKMTTTRVDEDKVVIVPILRAGLGMAEGLNILIPCAREGHIGLYRDPNTKQAVEYMTKLPDAEGRIFILVDPMLATGNSAAYAVDVLNKHGVPDDRIIFMALVAAPEGVAVFTKAHPSVPIFTAALDERLNDHAYIVPGLGDAGDRLFGTE
ncbi:MAG: uracil phosphoribosyltransferase [Holosporales bacterium]